MKKRVYLSALPFGAFCCALIWVSEAHSGNLHIVDQFGLPLLGVLFLALAVGVWRWPRHLQAYEISIFGGFALMYLASLGYSLVIFTNETAAIWNLAGLGYWGAVLYTLAFLVFGVHRGFWYSLVLYALSTGTSLGYFVFVPAPEIVPGTEALFSQHFAADGLVLFLLAAVGRAVAAQARAATRFELDADSDPLTLLSNRRRVMRLLEQERARMARQRGTFSVVLLDLDHFKQVNDTHGHGVGDEALVELGQLLGKTTRSVDVVGRWGGEEFIVLLPGLTLAQAREGIERLRLVIAEHPFPTCGTLTASFGVAEYQPGEPLAVLLQRADRALYRAKAEGRNQVVVELAAETLEPTTPGELLN